MNIAKNTLIFVMGAGIGSLITWKIVENKYKNLADEEIESVKNVFENKMKELKENGNYLWETYNNPIFEIHPDRRDLLGKDLSIDKETNNTNEMKNKSYNELTSKYKTDGGENEDKNEEEKYNNDSLTPYLIPIDSYGSIDDYDLRSWMYYNNNILTDEDDLPIDNYEVYIGHEALYNFDGEYGRVYVRNDKLKCDYEICRSEKDYYE